MSKAPPAEHAVALLERTGRFLTATPLFAREERGLGRLTVQQHATHAAAGEIVLLRVGRRRRGAVVERVIGSPDVARDIVEALLLDRGLPRGFEDDVESEARERARDFERGGRRDLTELTTFTIDPTGAKDFDDAISAEDLGGARTRIYVHIADVSAFVREDDALDLAARRRGNSVYVPGTVEPMLPHALSSDACSLRPGIERAAVTAELEIEDGRRVAASFYRSLIRSDERLDYERVQRILDGKEQASEPWGAPLALARAASGALRERREHAGALVVDTPEPEFDFDEQGYVTAVRNREQAESHSLIEHLMIAANEAVAELLERRGQPCLYRVHERPEPAAVERLVDALASLQVPTPPIPENLSPSQAAELLGPISAGIERHVAHAGHGRRALDSLLLRSLRPAVYSPVNSGHAGLHSRAYCHFTSPIRRYPDIVCHRALLAAVGGGERAPERGPLAELGAWCSQTERDAMLLERDADDIVGCMLLERELFRRGWDRAFEGEITGLIGAGAFLAFGRKGGERCYEGMLPVRTLRSSAKSGAREWWEINEQGTILRSDTGATLRLGDTRQVRVERVDALRGRVDLISAG